MYYSYRGMDKINIIANTFIVYAKTRPQPRPPYSRYPSRIKGGRLMMTYASIVFEYSAYPAYIKVSFAIKT